MKSSRREREQELGKDEAGHGQSRLITPNHAIEKIKTRGHSQKAVGSALQNWTQFDQI
jgi:hypothetical protein